MEFSLPLCGFSLRFSLAGFHGIYALIAVFMWAVSLLFTPRYFRGHGHRGRYLFFTLLTFAATGSVFLSADLSSAFLFFEIMSFASYPWVAQEETPEALRAAGTYLAVAVFGGMVTLMGLFWLHSLAGTLSFSGLAAWAASLPDRSVLYGPALLAFTGFAAKAGVFPLHIWLPKAHPVAPAPASALLSGILTKTGVFGMVVLSSGLFYHEEAVGFFLLALAGATMLLGAVMAVFSTDLKHTLACSSMSQIGFILTGLACSLLLGGENALAARGTFLHMVNHSLIKLDLFLCAGAVFMNAHSLDLTRLRGFGRKKPFLHFCFLMGYLGIIGLPLGNGYLSKSLLHEAILEAAAELPGTGGIWLSLYEKLFLFSGGLTAAYMTKLYLCLFWFRNRDRETQDRWDACRHYLSPASALALGIAALPLPLLGLLPDRTARPLAEAAMPFFRGAALPGGIAWFSGENLLGAVLSLGIGAAVCLLVHRTLVRRGVYLNRWPAWLDLESAVYRPLCVRILPAVGEAAAQLCNHLAENRLTLIWIPRAASCLARGLESFLENPFCLRWIPAAAFALCRGLERCADGLVLLLRHSLFRAEKVKDYSLPLSEKANLTLGEAWNHLSPGRDHVAMLISRKKEAEKAGLFLSRSVSFGLLLLALGLLIFLIFLLSVPS